MPGTPPYRAQVGLHVLVADPHAQYQKESEKGQVNGYAELGADGKVPSGQLPRLDELTARPRPSTSMGSRRPASASRT